MTPRVKQYLSLSRQYDTADRNASKFESGHNFNLLKAAPYRTKANSLINEMNAMNLTDDENQEIEDYYGC